MMSAAAAAAGAAMDAAVAATICSGCCPCCCCNSQYASSTDGFSTSKSKSLNHGNICTVLLQILMLLFTGWLHKTV